MNTDRAMPPLLKPFSDPAHIARYADGPPRFVPGFADLHRMTGILLAERAPEDAHVLVLGAGGGLELKALATAFPRWRFTGVDPAPEMLKLAERTLGPLAPRVTLVEGYIDDAPPGPFDAGVCLLTLHFLDAAERQRTLGEIHRRLTPGAPFVAMWREIVSMSYLRFEAHQLTSTRLAGIIGEIPHTPLDQAVAEALEDIGIATVNGTSKAA